MKFFLNQGKFVSLARQFFSFLCAESRFADQRHSLYGIQLIYSSPFQIRHFQKHFIYKIWGLFKNHFWTRQYSAFIFLGGMPCPEIIQVKIHLSNIILLNCFYCKILCCVNSYVLLNNLLCCVTLFLNQLV